MKPILHIILILILISSCRKDKGAQPGSISSEQEDFIFKPCSLLAEPIIGWKDSTKWTDQDIYRAMLNPLNEQEVIYMAGGKLFNYNQSTRVRKIVHNDIALSPGTPGINKKGWITFNNVSMQACIIKSNGDSLKVLASNALYPRWDYTGDHILFQQNSVLRRIGMNGGSADSLLNYGIVGVAKTANKVLSTRPSVQQLFMKNLDDGVESTVIIRDPRYDFLVFDNSDQNIYWGNGTIFSLNLSTLKIDTIVKGCPGGTSTNPANSNSYVFGTNISPGSDKLTFVYKLWIPVSNTKKYTESHILQMDLATKKITEIKIFE